MADEALRQLPEQFRALCKDLVIRVDEYPTDEVLDAMGIESELDLHGPVPGRRAAVPVRKHAGPDAEHGLALPRADAAVLGRARRDARRRSSPMCWCTRSAITSACRTTTWRRSKPAWNRRHREDNRETSMKIDGSCALRHHHHRRRGRSGGGLDLPLHRLPDRHRLGVPRLGAGPRRVVQDDGQPKNYLKTDGRQRQSAHRRHSARSAARRSIRPRRAKASRTPTACASASCASAGSSCRRSRTGSARRCRGSTA